MEFKTAGVLFCLVFVVVRVSSSGLEVNLTRSWKQDIGWEINCTWELPPRDYLQSVRLYLNRQQFMIFRPEIDGLERSLMIRRLEDGVVTNCGISSADRRRGSCVITSELYQPQNTSFTLQCEVSGERPTFIMEKKTIVVDNFVPPSDAVLTRVRSLNDVSDRVTLNCSASGVPSPNLTWTIGSQKMPHEFKGTAWNVTSKLWDVWSIVSYTPRSDLTAVCTPEATYKGEPVNGHAAQYNSAAIEKGALTSIITVLAVLYLCRLR
nr:uncharacterized protein LOC110369877 [Helicoverpa armigera]